MKKTSFSQLFKIFFTFFKIGAFTFGGGYAMIPLIQQQAVEKHRWVTDDDILEIVAIAESTPGPIAINAATFVGYRAGGILGSVFATTGVVLPSFVIILLLSFVLQTVQGQFVALDYAFFGIRAGVLALLVKALWTMYKKSPKGWVGYVIMGGAFLLTALELVPVIYVLIGCAVFGLVTSLIIGRRAEK